MGAIDQKRVAELLRMGANAATTKEKGDAFEELLCVLFESIPGIRVSKRNERNEFHTEEIDIAFLNERHQEGLPFIHWIILAECKNWSSPVGSEHVSWFDTKMRDRGVEFGVLFAANGVTGNAKARTDAHSIVAGALREKRWMIVLTEADVLKLTDSAQLVLLIKEKVCQLVVSGTLFSAA
jgi:hypothetical protein